VQPQNFKISTCRQSSNAGVENSTTEIGSDSSGSAKPLANLTTCCQKSTPKFSGEIA
jgi:hypothetical protein